MIDIRIEELAVKGMINPFFHECVQPCSYDVHLGENLFIESEFGFVKLDLGEYCVQHPYRMPPGCFLLGETIEYLSIPQNVEAHLHLVSSRAREGLNHALAGLIDCGFEGRLTLELKNTLQYGHINLYPGLRIGQLTFFEYPTDASRAYSGRYFGDTQVSMVKGGSDVLNAPWLQNLRSRVSRG